MTSGDRPGSGSDLSDMRSLPKWAGGRVSPPLERDRWRCGTLGGTEGSTGLRAAGVTRIGLRPCETTVARGRKGRREIEGEDGGQVQGGLTVHTGDAAGLAASPVRPVN